MNNFTKIDDTKAHAVFSASGSSRWMNCPGSITLSKDAPPQVESFFAKEGTEAHACLEFLLKNRKSLKGAMSIAIKKYGLEMANHAMAAVAWILNRLDEYPGAILECETRVDSSSFTCSGQFGTVDVAIIDEFGRLIVIDFKYGAGVIVDPEGYDMQGNSQLVYYALGISEKYHHNFEDVELVVLQPRAYHESGKTVRSFVMPMKTLLAWREKFLNAVVVCKQAEILSHQGMLEDMLFAGDWCKFCPAVTICPEIKNKAFKQAQIAFSDSRGLESVPEPKLVPDLDLGKSLDACEKLELWIEKIRAHAFHVLERGGTVTGYKLVDKRAQRKWADEKTTEEEAWAMFGEAAFTDPKLLSPAQLEKIKDGIYDADEIRDFVFKRTVKESSGRTIAKDCDNRLAINPIETVFTVIDIKSTNTTKKSKKK